MGLLSKASGALLVAGAALLGNWVGDALRATTTGEPGHRMSLMHVNVDGHTVVGLNVALTNFVPAFILAFLAGRPRMLYAFVSGAMISALIGDAYERALATWFQHRANHDQVIREQI